MSNSLLAQSKSFSRTKQQEISNLIRTRLLVAANSDCRLSSEKTETMINSKTMKEIQSAYENVVVELDQEVFRSGIDYIHDLNSSKSLTKQCYMLQLKEKGNTHFSPSSRKHSISDKKISFFNQNTLKIQGDKTNAISINRRSRIYQGLSKTETQFEKASDSFSYLSYVASKLKSTTNKHEFFSNKIKPKRKGSKSCDKKEGKNTLVNWVEKEKDKHQKSVSCVNNKINFDSLAEIITKELNKQKETRNTLHFSKKSSEISALSSSGNSSVGTPTNNIGTKLSSSKSMFSNNNIFRLHRCSSFTEVNKSITTPSNQSSSRNSIKLTVIDNNGKIQEDDAFFEKDCKAKIISYSPKNLIIDTYSNLDFKIKLKTCRKQTDITVSSLNLNSPSLSSFLY